MELQKTPWDIRAGPGPSTRGTELVSLASVSQPLVPIFETTVKNPIQSPLMSMGIRYFPQDLEKCTTSCTTPSAAKGGAFHKEHSRTRPKTTGASHTLLVADPYRAVLSHTANLPASGEQQTNTLVMARHGGHKKPVLFQDKTTETMRRSGGFTNPQSLMSQFRVTPGLVLHGELPEVAVLLPALGMPSHLLSCPPSRSQWVTQLGSRMEIITAAQAYKIHLSVEIHTHISSVESPCSQAITGHREKMGGMRNPWGKVVQSWTGMHSHNYPRLKWSYIQMGFQEKGCNVIFRCISFSTMRRAVLAQNTPRLLHIGFIPYSNEQDKAIQLSPYKNQIYRLYWAKCMNVASPPISTKEGYSRQLFCTDWL